MLYLRTNSTHFLEPVGNGFASQYQSKEGSVIFMDIVNTFLGTGR